VARFKGANIMGKLDEAQRHLKGKASSKPQAARAESTFRQQPKAQKQARSTKEEKQHRLEKGRKRIDDLHDPFQKNRDYSSTPSPWKSDPDPKADRLKKKRAAEKKRRTKLSGGSRQSQKRRQGSY